MSLISCVNVISWVLLNADVYSLRCSASHATLNQLLYRIISLLPMDTHTGHMEHISRSSAPSPKRNRSIAADGRPSSVPFTAQPQPPHDLSVICSVVKYFLRSLPEPVLTTSLGAVMESLPTDSRTMYESIARLVHQRLPRPHRYLLAWLLQHMVHIIDRAGENLMTQANIIIVLSPCLSISHRLLSILLGPPPLGK